MSIKFTGQRGFKTASNSTVLAGQTVASFYFRFRFDPLGDPATAGNVFLFAKEFYATFRAMLLGPGTAAGTVRLQFAWSGGTTASKNIDLNVGVTYTLGCTLDTGGVCKVWIDGVPTTFSTTMTGSTQSTARTCMLGIWEYSPTGDIYQMDHLAAWNGYALTAGNLADLRDGVITPAAITSGTARWYWPLNGTTDATVLVNAGGLVNAVDGTLNFITASGTGTAIYKPDLNWSPSVRLRSGHVGTSGRTVFLTYEVTATSGDVFPTTSITPPTIAKNGTPIGSLVGTTITGTEPYWLGILPAGEQIAAGDVVTISAGINHLTTTGGSTEAITGAEITNYTGQSCFGTESLARTLRMGINIESYPTGHNGRGFLLKNQARTISVFGSTTARDANNKPITLSATTAGAWFYEDSTTNGLDSTRNPGITGLFAISWDDTNPGTPTTFSFYTTDAATTVVTERTDLANPGIGGMGKVRVFDIQRAVASVTVDTSVRLQVSNSASQPRFDNLFIHGPGDFTYTDGVPVVLDRSQPYAMSNRWLDITRNAGSIRNWQHMVGSSASQMCEVEHALPMTEFTYGWGSGTYYSVIGIAEALPFVLANNPYYYTHIVGETYSATLNTGVDSVTTTLNVTHTVGDPVIIGLRLLVGSEKMRVTDVSGSTITVIRGVDGTTAASHLAGTIQVGYRLPLTACPWIFSNGSVQIYRTSTQHKLRTGQAIVLKGAGWPIFNFADGGATTPEHPITEYGSAAFVLGPDTFMLKQGPYTAPWTTVAAPITLNPATCYTIIDVPSIPTIPYGVLAQAASQAAVQSVFLALPHLCTDDMAWRLAREVRDNLTPGINVFMELSNETWNFPTPATYLKMVSYSLYPTETEYAYQARRSGELRDIWVAAFNEGGRNRGGSVKLYLNVQTVNTFGAAMLHWAGAQAPVIPVDAIAIAPYVSNTSNWFDSTTLATINSLDIPEAIDVWIHYQKYTTQSKGIRTFAPAWLAQIATYNLATGLNCQLVSYEGGIEEIYGGGASDWNAKNRDAVYHPNWYIIEKDWFALVQAAGFLHFNVFDQYNNYYLNKFLWGQYHHRYQVYCRGDGSDGKVNNLLTLARPGLPNSKAATTSLDLANGSVRGKAWLDWNGPTDTTSATIAGVGSISATATVSGTLTTSATIAGVGSISATAVAGGEFTTSAAVAGSGLVSAIAVASGPIETSASIAGIGSVTATATVYGESTTSATLAGVGSISVVASGPPPTPMSKPRRYPTRLLFPSRT
jgi:hypothetical protein